MAFIVSRHVYAEVTRVGNEFVVTCSKCGASKNYGGNYRTAHSAASGHGYGGKHLPLK